MIELVFKLEVGFTGSVAFGTGFVLLGENCDITAGAESSGASATNYYYTRQLGLLPFLSVAMI